MSRRQAANGSLLPKSRALSARDLYANSVACQMHRSFARAQNALTQDDKLQTFKDPEADASQLNRLVQDVFVGAQSSVRFQFQLRF